MVVAQEDRGLRLEVADAGPTVEDSLARDMALLRLLDHLVESGAPAPETLRFWRVRSPVVVLGRSGRPEQDVDLASCTRAGVPVVRRASGGGTVVLGPGCLNFTVVLAYRGRETLRDVRGSFAAILGRMASGLRVPGLARRGGCDLALAGRKVSGNAQLRGRHGLVHHGTLLHDFDPALPSRFLHEPRRQPRYRARRSHADFLGNVPLSEDLIIGRLAEAWGAKVTEY